jgi:hypothetical protein
VIFIKIMPVNKFEKSEEANVITSLGVTISQIGNSFLRRDGSSTDAGDINVDRRKLINVADPTEGNYVTIKRYANDNTVSKNCDMNVKNIPSLSLGCCDLKANKKFNVLLGITSNMISRQFNHPVTLQTSDGLLCRLGDTDIARIASKISLFQDVDMNDRKSSKLAESVNVNDAVTKSYVDRTISGIIAIAGLTAVIDNVLFLKLDGRSVMTGTLNLGYSVTNVASPSSPQNIITKRYVDSFSGSTHFDTKCKKIVNLKDPTACIDAVTKGYIDMLIQII